MFPASGKFTPDQRELNVIYVKLYNAIIVIAHVTRTVAAKGQ